jgi:ubiquinone/menaquinone biosynthesis C-methylase UbiE
MSKFSEKIRRGELPSDDDWSEHLIEGHGNAPSQTPAAFAAYKTLEGLNSYQILAHEVDQFHEKNLRIIDLACGDGHLIPHLLSKQGPTARISGIDMSEAELTLAKRNLNDPRVSFFHGKAQKLPFKDGSADLVLCHMAFMLMLPLEPVVSELARVLAPQGKFSAVIGNRNAHRGFFAEIARTAFGFISARYPKINEARSGDPRIFSEEGLQTLFKKELGFSQDIKRMNFELICNTSPAGIWDLMKNMYHLSVLSPDERGELKDLLIRMGQKHADANGGVSFTFSMTKLTVGLP